MEWFQNRTGVGPLRLEQKSAYPAGGDGKVKLHLKGVADANDSQAGELSILLSKEMLERVKQFKTLKGGEEPGGKWIEQWRLKELEKSVNETTNWAKEQSPLPIERAELLKRAVKKLSQGSSTKSKRVCELI